LRFPATKELQLVGYTDADWGGNHENGKSRYGYIFTLGGAPIMWRSKLMTSDPSLSAVESETLALTEAIKEGTWIMNFLEELGVEEKFYHPIKVMTDNMGTIKQTIKSVQHDRSKHYLLKIEFNKRWIDRMRLDLSHIPTDENLADMFTKALARTKLQKFRNMIMEEVTSAEGE
jgi:hypothetical protein